MVELADRGGQEIRRTCQEPDHYQSARYTYFFFRDLCIFGSDSHGGRVRVVDPD